MIGGLEDTPERRTKRSLQGVFIHAMKLVSNYLNDNDSLVRKQHHKIQEFAKLNGLEAPKEKAKCVNWIVELYLSDKNEYCRKGTYFKRRRQSSPKRGYKAASKYNDELIECARVIDNTLDSNESKYIKLGFAKTYLLFYCGYLEHEISGLDLYVHSEDLKTFLDKTTVTHANYLKSLKWAKLKDYIRERDNYTCSKCGANMENDLYNLHTHHLNYDRLGNENPATDLVLLCSTCHHKEHCKK